MQTYKDYLQEVNLKNMEKIIEPFGTIYLDRAKFEKDPKGKFYYDPDTKKWFGSFEYQQMQLKGPKKGKKHKHNWEFDGGTHGHYNKMQKGVENRYNMKCSICGKVQKFNDKGPVAKR